jgi:hypothetical protein
MKKVNQKEMKEIISRSREKAEEEIELLDRVTHFLLKVIPIDSFDKRSRTELALERDKLNSDVRKLVIELLNLYEIPWTTTA